MDADAMVTATGCDPGESGNEPVLDTSVWIAETVRSHERSLLAYAHSLLRDRSSAQDAVQETFLQLCRKTREIKRSSEPPTLPEFAARVAPWLFSVCRTRVIDMQRKRTPVTFARRDDGEADTPEVALVDPGPMPDESAVAGEQHRRVAESLGELTPRQREILQLRMQAGLSYREIADVTGLTATNVGFHLHQAVCKLRQRLAEA